MEPAGAEPHRQTLQISRHENSDARLRAASIERSLPPAHSSNSSESKPIAGFGDRFHFPSSSHQNMRADTELDGEIHSSAGDGAFGPTFTRPRKFPERYVQ